MSAVSLMKFGVHTELNSTWGSVMWLSSRAAASASAAAGSGTWQYSEDALEEMLERLEEVLERRLWEKGHAAGGGGGGVAGGGGWSFVTTRASRSRSSRSSAAGRPSGYCAHGKSACGSSDPPRPADPVKLAHLPRCYTRLGHGEVRMWLIMLLLAW